MFNVAIIWTTAQVSYTARNQSEVKAVLVDVNSFYHVCTENSSDCTARSGANMIKNTSEMELNIILASLENFECLNPYTFNQDILLCQTKQ